MSFKNGFELNELIKNLVTAYNEVDDRVYVINEILKLSPTEACLVGSLLRDEIVGFSDWIRGKTDI